MPEADPGRRPALSGRSRLGRWRILRSCWLTPGPLQVRHFRRLWTANIVTVIGAQLTVVAVPAQIYAQTGSSAYVGLTGVFGLVPLVVFGLYGGALADVFDRRTILVVTTLGLIGTSALFWLQAVRRRHRTSWLLLCLFAVQQAFFAVNQPTRSAVLPKLLPLELLPAANSLNMTVMQAGAIAGPLAAGVLIPVVGLEWLYLVDTITLFATLSAVVRLPRAAGAGRGDGRAGCPGGGRRLRLPAPPAGAADVVRRRHDRDGLRDAARAVPGDRARRLRRAARGRHGLRAAVRGDPGGCGARRGAQRLGRPASRRRGAP